MCIERKPHKHAALIKAWADGAVIEYRTIHSRGWDPVDSAPCWNPCFEYRVKPQYHKYKRYLTTNTYGNIPGVYCLQWEARHTCYPKEQKGFIKWIDTDWQVVEF